MVYSRSVKRKKRNLRPYEIVVGKLRTAVLSALSGDSLGSEVVIAKDCGVSRMTARKAVNALIAEGLVERRAGVGLFVRGSGPSGFVYRALFGNLFWDPAMKAASGIRRAAESVGAKIEYFDAGGEESRLLAAIKALPKSGVEGAIIFSQHGAAFDAAIVRLSESGFPFVVIDENVSCAGVSSFVSDNRAGGEFVAAELTGAGHRDLAFVGDFAADTVVARWEGFCAGCAEIGVKPRKYDIRSTSRLGNWANDVRRIVERILRLKARPTAFFCSCDAVARIAMRCLEDHGLKVPRDISLVGFDDDPIAEWTDPALTTVRQDFGEMGRRAFETLVARVANPSAGTVRGVIPVELVHRESVASTI